MICLGNRSKCLIPMNQTSVVSSMKQLLVRLLIDEPCIESTNTILCPQYVEEVQDLAVGKEKVS